MYVRTILFTHLNKTKTGQNYSYNIKNIIMNECTNEVNKIRKCLNK